MFFEWLENVFLSHFESEIYLLQLLFIYFRVSQKKNTERDQFFMFLFFPEIERTMQQNKLIAKNVAHNEFHLFQLTQRAIPHLIKCLRHTATFSISFVENVHIPKWGEPLRIILCFKLQKS